MDGLQQQVKVGLLMGGRVEKEQGGLVDIKYKKVKERKRAACWAPELTSGQGV